MVRNYYVEYLNGGTFENCFCDRRTVETLKRCKHIKILCVKRANVRTDRWEAITA